MGQAGTHSLRKPVSLEVRHRRDDVKQQLPAWRRPVDAPGPRILPGYP